MDRAELHGKLCVPYKLDAELGEETRRERVHAVDLLVPAALRGRRARS